ncbi:hypothetical protein SNE40_018357 [Patella caerulea]|uniref:Reverse transcriptase domain-containing protein n=1 Tax=Patella caerulea TaxID=87958 RepID=A0AAN8J842_PATCE
MPFGLANAPMSFQMVMSDILRDMNWQYVLVYVDDIIVFSEDFEQHLGHLSTVFKKLERAGITLKPSKCRFACKKVKYLGHYFSANGTEVDNSKVDAIQTIPTPKSQHDIRHFLGLCNYYRKFTPNYAKIATPLNQLLQKNVDFNWSEEC